MTSLPDQIGRHIQATLIRRHRGICSKTYTLNIGGQIGQRMDGSIPDSIVERSRLAWQSLEAQLKVNMALDNLVKVAAIRPSQGGVAAVRARTNVPRDGLRAR